MRSSVLVHGGISCSDHLPTCQGDHLPSSVFEPPSKRGWATSGGHSGCNCWGVGLDHPSPLRLSRSSPTFAKNKRQGWNAKNIERYLAFLFSLLGAGRGGDVDLSDKTKKPLWFSSKVDYRKFKCASYASMDDNVDLIKGIFDYFHLDWKTHNKFQAPAAEIPLEDPQVVTEDNVNDDVFLYCISSSC